MKAEVTPHAADWWNAGEFPHHMIPKIAELDVMSPVYRQGHSNLFAGLCHAEFTRADTSFATFLGVHDGLFTGSIEALASEEQKAAWLPDIYSMKKIGAFGLTEPLGGSDVAGGTRTTARRDGDNWILNGEKRWIGNATFSDWVVIYARDVADNQVKGFLDTKTKGYSATKIENKIALRTVQNADIVLDNVVVSDDFHLKAPTASRTPTRSSRSPDCPLPGRQWASRWQPLTLPASMRWSATSSASRWLPSSWSRTSLSRSWATPLPRWA
ncbi:hypothetical protein GCM10017708_39050 [Arthrobacter citreus]